MMHGTVSVTAGLGGCRLVVVIAIVIGLGPFSEGTRAGEVPGPIGQSALTADDIAGDTAIEWVLGKATASPRLAAGDWLGEPGSERGPNGFFFGASESAGPRHVRIGFKRPTIVGTVVTRGAGRLSVLRPDAKFPGDPARESDWLAADCQRPAQISVWVLPSDTKTRAIRWTAEGQPAASTCPDLWNDRDLPDGLVGWCGGLYAFTDRYVDVAPYAEVIPLTPGPDRERITDGEYRLWKGFGGLQWLWAVGKTGGTLDATDKSATRVV